VELADSLRFWAAIILLLIASLGLLYGLGEVWMAMWIMRNMK